MSNSSERLLKYLSLIEKLYDALGEEEAPVKLMHRIKRRDPFHALITAMLSPRSKDEQTYKVAMKLLNVAPTPYHIRDMSVEEIEEIIKPLGFYRQKARNIKLAAERIINEYDGEVPDKFEELIKFRGVGRKIANIILSTVYEKPAIAVDTHVYRIIKDRWKFVEDAKGPKDIEDFLMKNLPMDMWNKVNRWLVAFGQSICKPLKPRCEVCPLSDDCPYHSSKRQAVGGTG